MVNEDKPKAKIILRGHADGASTRAPSELPKWIPMRTQEELTPLALRIAENDALMRRFIANMGSGDSNLGSGVMDEVTKYAQELDPSITVPEGTRIVVLLMKIVGQGGAND